MMPAINGVLLAVSSSLAATIAAKVTITTALALIGTWLGRKSRAAVRHAVLAAAFGVLLLLPIVSIVAPPVPVSAAAQKLTLPAFGGSGKAVPSALKRPDLSSSPAIPGGMRLSPSMLLLMGWIAGTALFLLPVVAGVWQVRAYRRSALPWAHGQSIADRLALHAGIHRPTEVLLHPTLPGPMTCGAAHPAIVLPEEAQTWDAADLTRALIHELEHVRRRDWVGHCLARAVCAVYWFHPLVWIAWRQLVLEAERSCDDAVLALWEGTAYADQLIGLAQRLSLAGRLRVAKSPLLAMANRADLARRVGAVLDGRQRRGRAGKLALALAYGAAAVLVLGASPLKMVAASQFQTDAGTAALPRFTATARLVIVNVTVSDVNGRSIDGLNASDFALFEEGVSQTIRIFEFHSQAQSQGSQNAISSYYILGYYAVNPDGDGTFRRIQVSSREGLMAKLQYRSGYYAGGVRHEVPQTRQDGIDSTIPVKVFEKAPEYSEEARKARYQGTVVLVVDVNVSGEVTNVKVVRSLGLGLNEKAIEAVEQWKFTPATKDGKPVAAQAQVEVNFRLM